MDMFTILLVSVAVFSTFTFSNPILNQNDEEEVSSLTHQNHRKANELEFRIKTAELQSYEQQLKQKQYKKQKSFITLQTNGIGWCFIYDSTTGFWNAYEAFNGRNIELKPGTYTLAFNNSFGNGTPDNNSEFHQITVRKKKTVTVKMSFISQSQPKKSQDTVIRLSHQTTSHHNKNYYPVNKMWWQ